MFSARRTTVYSLARRCWITTGEVARGPEAERPGLAPGPLAKVARDAPDAPAQRLDPPAGIPPVSLARAHQHERPGGRPADEDRCHGTGPVARVAHCAQLPIGQLAGG